MSPLRDEVLNYLRQVFGRKSTLDIFTEGLDDPNFDPDKPYHGNSKQRPEPFMESEQAEMLVEMMTYALETMTFRTDRMMEDAYIVSRMRMAPERQVYTIKVA